MKPADRQLTNDASNANSSSSPCMAMGTSLLQLSRVLSSISRTSETAFFCLRRPGLALGISSAHLTFWGVNNVLDHQVGFALCLLLNQQPCKEAYARGRSRRTCRTGIVHYLVSSSWRYRSGQLQVYHPLICCQGTACSWVSLATPSLQSSPPELPVRSFKK